MEVAGGGAEAAVPEQDLDGPQVGAGLEQVGGEAVPQSVHMNVLAQARGRQRALADHLDGAWADRLVGLTPWEEVGPGPVSCPVLAQDRQQPWREHDVAILLPLGLANVDDHAATVDVLDAEPGDLRESQPAGVGRHEQRAVLGVVTHRKTGPSRPG